MPWARLQARQSGQEVVQLGQAAKRLTIPPNVRYAGLYLEASREARGWGMWAASPAKPQAPARGGCCNLAYPDMCIPPSRIWTAGVSPTATSGCFRPTRADSIGIGTGWGARAKFIYVSGQTQIPISQS